MGIKDFFYEQLGKQVEKKKLQKQHAFESGYGFKKSPEERKKLLEDHIISQVSQGYKLNTQTDFFVVLEKGKKPNHMMHFLLCFPTIGIWILVWMILTLNSGYRRKTFEITEYGVIVERD